MEFEIKKEGNDKFLSANKLKFDEHDYRIQMILNNHIKGLIPIKIRNTNNEKELLYDITAMSSLNNIFERKLLKRDDLVKFVLAIKQLEDTLKEFLLCADNIKFDLTHIYYRAKQNQYYFCYLPLEVDDFSLQMKSLFNQVLDYVNYNDRDAVSLAYGMQEIASRDDFAVEELLEFALASNQEEQIVEIDDSKDSFDFDEDDEEEEIKETFIDKIKNIFHKEKKKTEVDDFEEDIYIEETPNINDSDFKTDNLSDEDATVLLTQNTPGFIALTSVNCNPEIRIIPDKYPFVIGKSKRSSDYKVSSDVVSRVHARINNDMGEFTIEDLNSTNGTFVNDDRLKPHEVRKIDRGDTVMLADLEFSVE